MSDRRRRSGDPQNDGSPIDDSGSSPSRQEMRQQDVVLAYGKIVPVVSPAVVYKLSGEVYDVPKDSLVQISEVREFVRYGIHTRIRHLGTTSIPVHQSSVRSVWHPYTSTKVRYVRYGTHTHARTSVKFGTPAENYP